MKCVVHAEIITVPLKRVWWIWRERHRVCFWLNGYEQLQINQPWGQKTAKSFSRLLFPPRVSLEWSIQKNQDSNLLEQIWHVAAGLRGLKLQLKQLVTVCAEEFTSTMWTIPRWGSSGEEYSLSMNTRVIWLPCRTTKNSRWEDFIRQRIHFESLRLSACLCVCVCFYWDSVSGIFVCFAPWEWCRAWRLLQAETTRRLSWSECGDDTSVNLRRTKPGGDEMVLLGDFKMEKQRNKRKKRGRSDRLRA